MFVYKNYSYVQYICSLDVKRGLELYSKCLSRLQEQEEKILDDRLWYVYINRDDSLKDMTFEEFKKFQSDKSKIKIMDNINKDDEEKRIIKNSMKIVKLDKERIKNNDRSKRRITRIIKK